MIRLKGQDVYSLRLVLTLLILSGISVSVAVSSWLSTRDSKHQIEELFDAQMIQTAKMLELFYHTDLGAPVKNQTKLQILHVPDSQISTFAEKADALKLAYEHKLAFQIWSEAGEALVLSDNIGLKPITRFVQGYHQTMFEGQLWHVFSFFSIKNNVWIVTAQRDDVRQELVSQIMHNAVIVPLIVVPLTLLIVSLLFYLLFRPLKTFERELISRAPNDLTPLTMSLPKELVPVRRALNLYIDSIARFIARERRFSADAAHELKTPLSVIKLHQHGLESLIEDDPQQKFHLAAIDAGVEQMSHTVEQLLVLARVDSINELNVSSHGILPMIEDALNQLMPQITDYEWNMDITSVLTVKCDRFYLLLVLKNIIENACKYSPKESEISISARIVDDEISICIADKGQGMSELQIASATERFYRVNENEGIGAGLGLSICHHIIELHQGRLVLAARELGGLSVTIFLPREQHKSNREI
ncbi:two-component sensor histidine kinase [Shewanella morhuae]|uniref:histidine kinase n=1 Tax=Shewanella morhuae TaxID=365591 RepID=A0ABX5HV39_9GAMM|nr:ATP-binding protein [Shewanella morhuae]PTA50098.1 two-component sensor histidine kinase [Shewanella morhuae]SIR16713.1 two-component system, OmpR family, sensor histidine kinase QseC [Shewanella morhuae]